MIVWSLFLALLIAPAIANPIAQNRDRRLKICPQAINCLYKYGGEPFVTSFCSTDRITKTERVTSYRTTLTEIEASTTFTASAVTTTNTNTDFVTVPVATITVSTEYTGTTTVTNTIATITNTATRSTTAFTCDGVPHPPSVTPVPMPTPVGKAIRRQITSVTGNPATVDTATSTGTRTDTAAPAFTCSDLYGSEGLKEACKCNRVPKATITRTVTRDRTTIRTASFTVTPTVTASALTTISTSVSISVTATGISTASENATATDLTTTTTTLTTASPAPTAFQLTYNDTANTRLTAYRAPSPSSTGELIAFNTTTDPNTTTFSLNAESQLTQSDGSRLLIVSKNARDPFPFLFLGEGAPTGLTPYCAACNGTLACEFPGGSGGSGQSEWAVCDGYLALGRVEDGGDCRRITLGVQAV